MDLGAKEELIPTTAMAMLSKPEENKEPKIRYPNFCLRDDLAEKFAQEFEIKKDQEFTAVVKLKVSGWSDQEYGKNVEFSVMELTPQGEKSGKSDKKAEAETAEETASEEKPAISALLKD